MLSKDQIEEWERSESYYSALDEATKRTAVIDPYEDAPVVEDAYKQDFGVKYNFQSVSGMVEDFMRVTNQKPDSELYAELIDEEYREWDIESYGLDNEAQLKELADLVYVIYGYALSMGWDLEVAVQRVHNNNLARVVQSDGSVKKDHRGKILKRENAPKVYLGDLV